MLDYQHGGKPRDQNRTGPIMISSENLISAHDVTKIQIN